MGGQCGGPTQVKPQTFPSRKGLEDATEPGHHKDQERKPNKQNKSPTASSVLFLTGQEYRELELGKNKGLGRMWGQGAVGS